MTNSTPSSSSTPLSSSTTSATTISNLPQPLLLHILSLLYLPEAIQTSLISRDFLNLWHSFPSLHFNIFDFYDRPTMPDDRTDQSRRRFSDFVSQTLNIRHLNPLNKLQLRFECPNFDEYKFHVYSWIRYAINASVSELVLDFIDEEKHYSWKDPDINEEDEAFDFHLVDIGNSSIQVLKLYNCLVHLPPKTSPIKYVSLKSLELGNRVTVLGDDYVYDMLERCVNLEILKLMDLEFEEPGVLRFYSTSLKELYVDRCATGNRPWKVDWDICCPRLQKFSLMHSRIGKYTIKHTTLLVEAWVAFFPFLRIGYNNVKILSCFTNISRLDPWAEVLESNEVPAGCEKFASNIKHLELIFPYDEDALVVLAALLKLLPKLEILGLQNRFTNNEKLHGSYRRASTVFNMPCLKEVILRSYKKTKRERHFIKLFKKNGVVLDKIMLVR